MDSYKLLSSSFLFFFLSASGTPLSARCGFTEAPPGKFLKGQPNFSLNSTSAISINPSILRSVFESAFVRWSAVTNKTFTAVPMRSDPDPDITISFYSGDHGDGKPFDGVLGTVAHALMPIQGRWSLHMDAAEHWVVDKDITKASSDDAMDLETVAMHMIGHLLGLEHSAVEQSVMFPVFTTKTRKVEQSQSPLASYASASQLDVDVQRNLQRLAALGLRRLQTLAETLSSYKCCLTRVLFKISGALWRVLCN